MRSPPTQAGAALSLTTPFGADVLLADTLQASEGLSELFQVQLTMRSTDPALDASRIVGCSTSVALQGGSGPVRHFNGITRRFVHTGGDRDFAHYSAEIVPRLWLLTLSRDRRIWQNQTVPQIVQALLGEFGVVFDDQLSASYTALEYCVQYDESAFDFVSRLMEAAGIFYFFRFAAGSHTLVLADAASAHPDCPGAASVPFAPAANDRHRSDGVASFALEDRLVAQTHVVNDFDPLHPGTALSAQATGSTGKGEQVDWSAGHTSVSAGQALARLRLQASQVDGRVLRGDSRVYPFSAGCKFTLTGHFRASLNTAHVLRRVQHTVQDGLYRNHFEAFEAAVPFRAPLATPRPRVAGSHTATVVGPQGEEIWTDQHGRIKVQFPWDRLGKKDDSSSCWVRVMQSAAGAGFGALFLPRVGQEVVVTHVDGDPDRPLVTGSVYNGEHAPPVTLPANQTQSVIKTRSSKQGTAGNEIRLEDKKDSEELYLHAQKDMTVEIENDLSTTLKKGSETRTLTEGDRTTELKAGKETHKVKGTRSLTISGNETHTNEAAFTQTVKGDYKLTVSGNLVLDVSGSITLTAGKNLGLEAGGSFSAEAGSSLTQKAGTSLTSQAGTSLTSKAGTGLVNQAGTTLDLKAATITSKASAMQTVDGGGMLTLKGGLAKIN